MTDLSGLKWVSRVYPTGQRTTHARGEINGRYVYVIIGNWLSATRRFHVTVKVDKWPVQYISTVPCTSIVEGRAIAEREADRLLAIPALPINRRDVR